VPLVLLREVSPKSYMMAIEKPCGRISVQCNPLGGGRLSDPAAPAATVLAGRHHPGAIRRGHRLLSKPTVRKGDVGSLVARYAQFLRPPHAGPLSLQSP
jgi:hypothetical protein